MKINLKKIMLVLTLISTLFGIFSTMQSLKHKAESKRLENNLYTKTVEYEDDLGRKVTETTQLELKVKDLKNVMKKDSSLLNGYEKKLKMVYQELNASNRKVRNLEKSLVVELETNLSFESETKDTVFLNLEAKTATFKDSFGEYNILYVPEKDSLFMDLKIRNELFIDMFRERKPNKKGKPVFFAWRWLKSWEYKGSVKTLNDSTTIKDFILLDIQKK